MLACFNHGYKLDAGVFAAWMRILAAVPGAVLWLLEKYPAARAALEAAAERHGIARTRLVFSPRVPKAQHLARLRHADLFLDTWRCNAHTTASDALWVDVPVVTRRGSGLATRVAASLLEAVGLPELIARDADDYVDKVIALARAPERLHLLKETLAANKLTQPLFDTARYTRDLERAYSAHVGPPRARATACVDRARVNHGFQSRAGSRAQQSSALPDRAPNGCALPGAP